MGSYHKWERGTFKSGGGFTFYNIFFLFKADIFAESTIIKIKIYLYQVFLFIFSYTYLTDVFTHGCIPFIFVILIQYSFEK